MNLKPFVDAIEKQRLKTEGIIVLQQGRETGRFFWAPDCRRNVRSVAKSFASVAVGMAIDEGKLSLNDKITSVLAPEWQAVNNKVACTQVASNQVACNQVASNLWNSLTLEHLLTMTMGHAELSRPRTLEEALSYKLTRKPGTVFSYDNTCTFLASAMLTKASGLTMRDYLLERLFRPLGIPDPEWAESSDAYTIGSTGLFLSTAEMAVFGQFLLRKGNWEGKQLVSAAWIDEATRSHAPAREGSPWYSLGYGYHFWISPNGAFRCDGRGGQFIIVFPALDAVAAINSDEEDMAGILKTLWDKVLPELY